MKEVRMDSDTWLTNSFSRKKSLHQTKMNQINVDQKDDYTDR